MLQMKVCNVVNHPRDGWFGSLQELFIEDIFEIHVEKMKGKNSGNKTAFLPSFTHPYMILWNFILWNTKVDILNDTYVVFESILKLESFSPHYKLFLFCKCMHKPPKRILLLCFMEERQSCKTAE